MRAAVGPIGNGGSINAPAADRVYLDALVAKAYRTLEGVLDNPASALATAPVVLAARVIITTAAGEGVVGKKEQRAMLATEENVGRLATPSAPRLIINNR
jgi:hypothetical protein